MFESDDERGQVGIGTLIVFIAMVLVAAIAAGVLINTAGFLQSKSQQTGQQSSQQVSSRLQEVTTVGTVIDSNQTADDANTSNNVIDVVEVTVTLAPGADEIDLENASITWIDDDGTLQLLHENAVENPDLVSYDPESGGADTNFFNTSVVKDADGTAPVLNDADDRLKLTFNVSNFRATTDGTAAGHTDPNEVEGLESGEEVTIKINTAAGATTVIQVTVPDTLEEKSAVEL
jgi:flagellin-like protein